MLELTAVQTLIALPPVGCIPIIGLATAVSAILNLISMQLIAGWLSFNRRTQPRSLIERRHGRWQKPRR